jgi:hypothetical protein
MEMSMKTYLCVTGVVLLFGTSLLTSSFAFDASGYLVLTRHRDSNGHLLAGPIHHQAQSSVVQKTVVPAQPKTLERRNTDWGMNLQDVKTIEPVQPSWELRAPVLEDYEQRVAYRSQIEGIDTSLMYRFYEDQLAQAKYFFEPNHEDAAEYIQDFHTVKHWITQSYGMPTLVQEIWLDSLYRSDESLWGKAVMRGHLKLAAEWRTDTTHITILLDGGDDTLGLIADFNSVAIGPYVPMEAKGIESVGDIEKTSIGKISGPAAQPGRGKPEGVPKEEGTSHETDPQDPDPDTTL